MGARSIAAYNPTLTNFASGLAQDLNLRVAEFMAPIVIVPAGIGAYKALDSKNAFQLYNTDRAMGGPASRIQFKATDPTFDCRPQALEVSIDDAEYDAAGDANAARLEQSRIKTLISSAGLAYENKVLTKAKTITAEAGKGVWSDTAVDVIKEIDEQIEALSVDCGMMPNRIVMGISTWRVIKNHPKVLERASSVQSKSLNLDQFSGMLLNPSIQIRVGMISKDTAKFGATKSATNIVGAELFIFYGQDNPSEYDPSFMKTFRTKAGGVDAVRTYRDEQSRSIIHAVDWSEDVKITGSACVKRITLS